MADELLRPGVEVIQATRTPAPTFVRPTLASCVIGPAFEVINVLKTDGTLNSKAKYGAYTQVGLAITESSFPDPRANIDELDIIDGSVKAYMLAGGQLNELPMDEGEGFLATSHGAGAAALRTVVFNGGTGLALNGLALTLSIDNPVPASNEDDITVIFSGSGNLIAQDAADQINEAVGFELASVVGTAPNDRVQLTSPTFGAKSSVTVRAGGGANAVLGLAIDGDEERVEGAGYRGQDDNDNDTLTPWIEFFAGRYLLAGTATTFPATAGLVNITTREFTAAAASAVTFGASGTIPLVVGDRVYADGVRLKNGEVMKVEGTRFRVGTINTTLSVADENGDYVSKVYDVAEVETPFDDNPFAPGHVWFKATGLEWRDVAPVAASLLGGATGTAATSAVVTGVGAADPFALAGLRIHYVVTEDGEDTEGNFTFTGGPFADMAAVVAAIGSNIPGVAASVATDQLRLTTTKTGRLQSIRLKADGTANALLGFSTSADTTATGTDVTFSGLSGKSLQFTLDDNPHVYTTVFSDDSLDLAVDEINAVVGAPVASKEGTKLKLTSTLKGKASSVAIVTPDSPSAEDTFKLEAGDSPAPTATAGSGRPLPDAYIDDANVLNIQPQLLRDQVKGTPLDQVVNTGDLYVQYKALRKDVSASAKEVGVLRIADVDTLTAVLDPVTEENPLALGMFLAMVNAPNFEIKGLGIDEVTAAAPEGTTVAWARAAGVLEAEEVFALAPLSSDEAVHGLWLAHAQTMSEPEQGGERIAFINKKMPTRKNSAIALSGSQANTTLTANQFLLDANPTSGLLAAGVNPGMPIGEDDEAYLELEVDGEIRRYSVSSVTGALVNIRTSFTSDVNDDGFFSTAALDTVVINTPYALKVRGASLVVPGSNPPLLDYSLVAETVAGANASLRTRRGYSVFPDVVKTTIGGIEKAIPGYYACAAIAGMCSAQPPQQGFTNFPIAGLTGVVGSDKFSKKQLNVMAGGGTYILVQDVAGGAVLCRHQLSTDTSSIEFRELSITKDVDFVAKFLPAGVRKYIGINNVNEQLLDTIGSTVHAMLEFLVELGVLNGAALNEIAQDAAQPDTVLVDVTLDVPYPANYIRLTLFV
jgi:hypothetical protein